MTIDDNEFCKFFLYSFLDATIADIRFDAHEDELSKDKIWRQTNLVIEIPLKLYNASKNDASYYTKMVNDFEETSKKWKIHKWYILRKEMAFDHYCKIQKEKKNT